MFQSGFVLLLSGWSLLVGSAPVEAADLVYPLAVAAATDGTVYVADRKLPGIWKIEDGSAEIHFQGSKKYRTPLNAVRCVAVDANDRLLAGDSATREVYRFDAGGKLRALTGGAMGIPAAIAVAADGTLAVADLETQRIWMVPAEGGEPREFAQVAGARGLAYDGEGRLWVAHSGADPLLRFDADGNREVVVSGRPFEFPHNVVLAGETAYVSDGYAKTIWKIEADREPQPWVRGAPLDNPVGLAVHRKRLLLADPRAKAVFSIDPAGKLESLVKQAASDRS